MNIEIDEQKFQDSINDLADKAVAEAFRDYNVQHAVSSQLTEQVLNRTIAKALESAQKKINPKTLVTKLAAALEVHVSNGMKMLLTEAAVEMLWNLRGNPGKYNDQKELYHKTLIRFELTGEGDRPSPPEEDEKIWERVTKRKLEDQIDKGLTPVSGVAVIMGPIIDWASKLREDSTEPTDDEIPL